MKNLRSAVVLLSLFLPSVMWAEDDPIGTAGGGGTKSTEVIGTKKDWSIIAITTSQYFKLRNLVRDAYIEVQTWKALKANWEAQKDWFHRNHQRWNRITTTMSNLSSDPKDIFTNLKKIEEVSNEIDKFILVETKELDFIMKRYEDNASVAWDVAGPYLGNRYVPADELWKRFNWWCQDHTMRNSPEFKKQVALSGDDPGYVDPIYNLPEWRRRNILGKTFSVIQAQNDALVMRRTEREKYWSKFNKETSGALVSPDGSTPKADAIHGVDVMRRVQTMADMNDLVLARMQAMQTHIALAGEEIYKESNHLNQEVGGINELKMLKSYFKDQI